MGLIRAILSVVVGVLLAYGLPWVLEGVLVRSFAGRNLYTTGDYYMVRNTAGIIAARLAMAVFVSVLSGHLAARIAGSDAVRTVAVAASAITMMMIWDFTGSAVAGLTPIWLRVALVVITGPAMVLGAYVRAAVAELRAEQAQGGV